MWWQVLVTLFAIGMLFLGVKMCSWGYDAIYESGRNSGLKSVSDALAGCLMSTTRGARTHTINYECPNHP